MHRRRLFFYPLLPWEERGAGGFDRSYLTCLWAREKERTCSLAACSLAGPEVRQEKGGERLTAGGFDHSYLTCLWDGDNKNSAKDLGYEILSADDKTSQVGEIPNTLNSSWIQLILSLAGFRSIFGGPSFTLPSPENASKTSRIKKT